MAIPQLSPEDRAAALEKAKAARIKRAEVREELKTGKLTVAQVLDMREDPVVGRMKISTLIETLPGYGKAKAERIMRELQIAESRRIRGIGERQREALLARLNK
ncbi:integration host factor, actinobacterial type [uncultured Adlercreutzia sp.]|uniref:integration host factor, actinobacterial type n=1 Tax=uncultured Adlercreutzia sp. TaxID=875803 RepID=UPI0025FF4FCE|nr:integration host factor, actinobacterial type [uncultured Adlercreutzia sp.]